jgi:fluoride exporter
MWHGIYPAGFPFALRACGRVARRGETPLFLERAAIFANKIVHGHDRLLEYGGREGVYDARNPPALFRLFPYNGRMNVLLVAAGGAIGASLRYLAGVWLAARLGPDFPWGTFFVNVTGSFFIGVILVLVEGGSLPAGARLFLAVGVMGGYTTFSSYSHETLGLISGGEFIKAFVYVFGQLLLGFVGVYLGVVAGRLLGGA